LGRYYNGCELNRDYNNLIQKRTGEGRGTLTEFL